MKIIILSLLFLTVPKLMLSQTSAPRAPVAAKKAPTKKATVPETGELTGFVFAITKAGDLKPARLAHIVLLYMRKNRLAPNEEGGKTAGWKYVMNQFKTSGEFEMKESQARVDDKPLSQEQRCLGLLQEYTDALKLTIAWAGTENKLEQIKSTDADEEGHFKITLAPGEYTLTAIGQAGMNMAYWQPKDEVVILAGQTTSVKLSSPAQSCLSQ